MDARNRQTTRELQRDGRQTNLDLARVNLSPAPCLRRVRLLEEAGVFPGYGAVVDPGAYGLRIAAFIRITLARHEGDAVRAFGDPVQQIDEIQDCHLLTGEADYLLRVMVADLEGYEAFARRRLPAIAGIVLIATSLVHGTVKATRVFPATAGAGSTTPTRARPRP